MNATQNQSDFQKAAERAGKTIHNISAATQLAQHQMAEALHVALSSPSMSNEEKTNAMLQLIGIASCAGDTLVLKDVLIALHDQLKNAG